MDLYTWTWIGTYIAIGIVLYYGALPNIKKALTTLGTPFTEEELAHLKESGHTAIEVDKMQDISQTLATFLLLFCWAFWPLAILAEGWRAIAKHHKNGQ